MFSYFHVGLTLVQSCIAKRKHPFFFLNRKCITPLNSNLAMAHIEFFRMYPIFDKALKYNVHQIISSFPLSLV